MRPPLGDVLLALIVSLLAIPAASPATGLAILLITGLLNIMLTTAQFAIALVLTGLIPATLLLSSFIARY